MAVFVVVMAVTFIRNIKNVHSKNAIYNNITADIDMNDKKMGQLNAIKYMLSRIPYPDKNEDIIQPAKTKVYEVIPQKEIKKSE